MSDEYGKSLNGFKSWYASKVEHRSLEDKKKMLAEMKATEDPTVYDINDEMIEFIKEEIANAE